MADTKDKRYNQREVAEKVVDNILDDLGAGFKKIGDSIGQRADKLYDKVSGLKDDPAFKDFYASVTQNAEKGKDAVVSGLEALADKYNATQNARIEERPKLTGAVDGFYAVFANKPQRRSIKKKSVEREYMKGVGIGQAIGTATSGYLLLTGGLLAKVAGAVPAAVRAGPKIGEYFRKKVAEAKETLDAADKERE